MKKFVTLVFLIIGIGTMALYAKPSVYVDGKGVMRWSDTHKEAVFFGVNYTLPFAHAYRAMGYLGIDRKEAIRRDVYHFARLGLNAYRIHLWDQELTDRYGNLQDNDHLDLMDYLLQQVEERGMYVLITFQTDFGNGYPERDNSPYGYSSPYSREEVLRNPEAIAAQKNYISQLLRHVNKYTGKMVKDDPSIVGFELTNEPRHSGTLEEVKGFVNTLTASVREAGCRKPVFYNVSESPYYAPAIYTANIQGVTFQWYPEGLVAGRTRRGNFLPYVDRYVNPFEGLDGAENKTKVIYEFDPADILYSYMYPAMVRSFRTAGFQWMTQFSYDPIDMAAYNTEYQTHYLNLAYVPRKALSMKIAAEVAQRVPSGKSYGTYPVDTLFENVRVSHHGDLSELNDGKRFYYTNSTTTKPLSNTGLESVAGWGSSQVVDYEGTGAYFLDRLEKGIWRLEVMPDAVVVKDPFGKPSFGKKVVRTFSRARDMKLNLADLGKEFAVTPLNEGNCVVGRVESGLIKGVKPGVYLLKKKGVKGKGDWTADTRWKNIRLGEFVAPEEDKDDGYDVVSHTPEIVTPGDSVCITVEVAGKHEPDSVIVMTDQVSFWNKTNPYVKLQRTKGYTYTGILPVKTNNIGCSFLRYNVIVCRDGEAETFPQGVKGMPLDWDFADYDYYTVHVIRPGSAVTLVKGGDDKAMETYMWPGWTSETKTVNASRPDKTALVDYRYGQGDKPTRFFLRKEIGELVKGVNLAAYSTLCLQVGQVPDSLSAGFVTTDGFTYTMSCPKSEDGVIRIPLDRLVQGRTALLPHSYPGFQPLYFEPEVHVPFDVKKIDALQLSFTGTHLQLGTVWLETN